ncbi:hypothetical protein KSD_64910 [Ktedonobacter sp. SOSP1-85]|uniref:extracellular solute-binding protein n=1 Tax=Ktedonobacter sp. SOSP1-85 TaxID=2778367 RepID=UPI001915A681|nr:extracellular solute-binding protein [Ktedonobacter sp. SOSP1-85]GHO78720.1 hypothetical protein KSD_64910 [Ktedonobacter sp. SOSP1-85]
MYASSEFTKAYISEFEKLNSTIKIKFIEYDDTRLSAMLASGTPPDFVRGAAVGSANNNARGLALNLDAYLEKSSVLKKSDLQAINNGFRWDGKQSGQGPYYGIVKDWSQDATLWYNKALFEQAGVTPLSETEPVSYDDLLELAKKLTVAVLVTLSSALVGFGFARLRGRGKRPLFLVMLSTMMLPNIVTLIPTYMIFARLGIVDTYWPWVLWGLASTPYLTFLFRQFFSAIPSELEEAAILDGCGYGRIFWRIFLPLSAPVLVTAFLISFTGVWGDYITPSLLLSLDNTTLAVAISTSYLDPHGNGIPTLQAAGALIYIIPEILIFFFAQRYFVRGIMTSGMKG